MLRGEVLPHEAADHLDAPGAYLGELVEAVVLIAEDRLDALALDPLGVVGERDVVLRRLGHARAGPRHRRGKARPAAARAPSGAGEDEGLMAQRVERRTVWRPTTGWPRLNHLVTTPTRIRGPTGARCSRTQGCSSGHRREELAVALDGLRPGAVSLTQLASARRELGPGAVVGDPFDRLCELAGVRAPRGDA